MNTQRFLVEFAHIASAPNGISRLKDLVLQLAISGRLVEPSAFGTSVAEELATASKLRAAYEGKYDIRPAHHSVVASEPFAIPSHWQWITLEQLSLYIQRGKGPRYAHDGEAYVVSQKCVQWHGFNLKPARHVADEYLGAYGHERFLCHGDVLWNSTGTGTAGRAAIFQDKTGVRAVADSHVTVIRLANSIPRYVWCVIASPWVQARIQPTHPQSLVSGSTQQVELATSTARGLPIPCPPIEEQARIVAKVDELMALCDTLQAQQQRRRELQNVLRRSTLQSVTDASSPQQLQTSWERLSKRLELLFNTPDDVVDLKGMILDLAVSGRLLAPTMQARSTGKALLEEIETARTTWVKSCAGREKDEAASMLKKLRTHQIVVPDSPIPGHWALGLASSGVPGSRRLPQ